MRKKSISILLCAMLLTFNYLISSEWKLTEDEPVPLLQEVLILDGDTYEIYAGRPIDYIMFTSLETLYEPKIIAWAEIPELPKKLKRK